MALPETLIAATFCSVGRRKFLKPLYAELLKTPESTARSRKIYGLARPGYYYISRNTLEAMIGAKLGST
jgi:hypothetical protein